jgi:hypothetical protein
VPQNRAPTGRAIPGQARPETLKEGLRVAAGTQNEYHRFLISDANPRVEPGLSCKGMNRLIGFAVDLKGACQYGAHLVGL